MSKWSMPQWQEFLTPFQFDPMALVQLRNFDVPEFIKRIRKVFYSHE